MRKIILFNLVTVDGLFEGPNQDISWHNVDDEFNDFAREQLDTAGGLLFGRVTYQLMASYWPSESALRDDPVIAGYMNRIPKVVFSRTLETADWNNTRLVNGNAGDELAKLKQQPGRDLYLFGSARLAADFTRLGLIDEYRLMVNPVILGQGTALFQGLQEKLKLKLLRTKVFRSGNVLLYYTPEG